MQRASASVAQEGKKVITVKVSELGGYISTSVAQVLPKLVRIAIKDESINAETKTDFSLSCV